MRVVEGCRGLVSGVVRRLLAGVVGFVLVVSGVSALSVDAFAVSEPPVAGSADGDSPEPGESKAQGAAAEDDGEQSADPVTPADDDTRPAAGKPDAGKPDAGKTAEAGKPDAGKTAEAGTADDDTPAAAEPGDDDADDAKGSGDDEANPDEADSSSDSSPASAEPTASAKSSGSTGTKVAPAAGVAPAAAGTLATITPVVVKDSTVGANGPVVIDGVTLDDSDSNGLIATRDRAEFGITVTYAPGVAVGDTMRLVGTLPAGVTWLAESYSAVSCDAGYGGLNTGTFTCMWTAGSETSRAVSWFASVGTTVLAQGDTWAATFQDGNGTLSVTTPALAVVSSLMHSIRFYPSNNSLYSPDSVMYSGAAPEYIGERGFRVRIAVDSAMSRSARGVEGTPSYSYELILPAAWSLMSCSSVSCTQPGGVGAPVLVTGTGIIDEGGIYVFIPNSALTSGVRYRGQIQVLGFDPIGLSGRSNYDDGFFPSQAPGTTCTTGGLCAWIDFTPTFGPTWLGGHLFGYGGSRGFNNTVSVVFPGQSFNALSVVAALDSSTVPLTGVGACETWDRSLVELAGAAAARGPLSNVSSNLFNFPTIVGAARDMPVSDYVVEYASVSGLNPSSFVCGEAGAGNATATWVSDLTQVAGGVGAVNAIRWKYLPQLEIASGVGLYVPFVRPVTPESLSPSYVDISFRSTRTANEFASSAVAADSVKGQQARLAAVQVASSGSAWAAIGYAGTAAAGGEAGFQLTLRLIGPAADVDTEAADTTVRLSFNSPCVDVSTTMAALAAYNPVLINAGAGLAACGGPGNPSGPVITLNLGDLPAPGSSSPAVNTGGIGGNETYYSGSPIEVFVMLSPKTPTGTTITLSTVVSSSSVLSGSLAATSTVRVNTPRTFTARKAATVFHSGLVDPGETYVYRHLLSNTELADFGVASFVDVLPFPGDPRLAGRGDGLAVGDPLTVTGASASMYDGASAPVPVSIYCSSFDAATIYASLSADKTGGPIPGTFGWADCSGAVPTGTTAVRFVTGGPLESFAMVSATVTVRAPVLAAGGYLVNDMSYDVPAGPGSVLVDQRGVTAPVVLEVSAAEGWGSLSGTVRRDLNFNGTADAVATGGDGWWPAGATVQLLSLAGEVVLDEVTGDPYLATVGADGAFDFSTVPAGQFRLALRASHAPPTTWRLLSTSPVYVAVGSSTVAGVLYQEIVTAPALVDDPASGELRVRVGGSVTVDVTANDTLSAPVYSTVTPAQLVLGGSGTTARGGTYVTSVTPGAVYPTQPRVLYTASSTWPSGVTGTVYTDSFTYSWTNASGASGTATVTITVQAAPTATGGSARVAVGGSHTFTANPQTAGSIASASVTSAPSQGSASVNAATGMVTFNGTGAPAGTYTFTVTWTDDLGQTGTSSYSVTVQAAPTATGGSARVAVGGSHTFTANPQTAGSIASASVTSAPSQGSASVNASTGMVTYSATGASAGTYTFTVTWTDDLGQTGTSSYTVTVQAAPTATGGTATVAMGGSHTFTANPQTAGSIASASVTSSPSQGSASVNASTGRVTFSATGAAAGTYTFTVTWTDDLGQTGTSSYSVTVQAAPTATGGTATVAMGGSHTFNANPQTTGSIASASVTTSPSQGSASVNASTGGVTFSATGAAAGTYTFTVTWTDDLGQTGTSSYTVTVRSGPSASGGTASIPVGGSHTFNANPQTTGSIASASVTTAPSQGSASVNASTGMVTFNGTGAAAGTYTFTVTWTDDIGQTGTSSYTVTVQAAPTATGGTATIAMGGSHTFTANPQTVGSIASAAVTTSPSQGSASVNASTGMVTFNGSGAAAGTYTFTVTWTDNIAQTGTSSYTVTVQAAPTATDGTATVAMGGSHTFNANPQTTGSIASASVTTSPSQGSASVNASTGRVTFSATGAAAGTYTFTVTWTDNIGQTGTSSYSVTVQAAPTASGGTATIGVGGSYTFTAAPQTEGSIASASVTTSPAQGSATVNRATGEVTFDGSGAAPGTYTFTVTWTDNLGQTGTSSYSVTVQAGPAVSGTTSGVIAVNGSRLFTMVVPATVTSASVTRVPACDVGAGTGSVTSNANGEVRFVGTGVAAGAVCTFEVSFADALGQSAAVGFTVRVQAPPTATGGTATVGVDQSKWFNAAPQTTGSIASASVTTAPAQGAAAVDHATGEVVFDASGAAAGTYTFIVTWTDDLGQTGTSSYSVTVQAAPTATGGTATIAMGGSHTFTANPQTAGSIASASVTSSPSQGSASVNASTGMVAFNGTGAAAGTYTFTVTWTDDVGQTGMSSYSVTVQAGPTASGGTAKVPVGGSHTFTANPQPAGAIASASVTTAPSQGAASVNHATGMVSFSATGAAPGTYSFTVTWTDTLGQTGTSSYSVTVQAAPTASGGTATIGVGGSHTFAAAPQTTGSIASASVTTSPTQGAAAVDHATGAVTFGASGAAPGTYTFTVTWVDDLGQTGTSSYSVTVQDAPVVSGGTTSAVIAVNGSHLFTMVVPATVTSASVTRVPACDVGAGTGSVTSNANGEVRFVGTGVAAGAVCTFEVSFSDALGQSAAVGFTVRVQAPPTATGGTATIGVGRSASFNGLPQTTGSIASASVTTAPGQGSAAVDHTTAAVSFDGSGAAPGTYTFIVTWVDDLGQTGASSYSVTVQAAPTATGGTATIRVGGSHTFNAAPQTTGSVVSASVTAGPSQGAASVTLSTGRVSFDGAGAAPGTYAFVVTWVDDLGQAGTSSYSVTVQAPPTATGGTAAVGVNGSHTFAAAPQTTGSIASASVTTSPTKGTATVNRATGAVTFDATGAGRGTYTFTVTWTDDLGQEGTSSYSVTVQAGPIVTSGATSGTIAVDGRYLFALQVEAEGALVSASVTGMPTCDAGAGVGSVTSNTNGEVRFDGAGVAPGAVCTFEVSFTDAHGQSAVVPFTVTVQAPPIAAGGTATVGVDQVVRFNAAPQTIGAITSASISAGPLRTAASVGTATVNHATGEVTYDATGAQPGTYSFSVSWTDDLGQTGTSSYQVTVRDLVVTGDTTSRVRVGESHTHVPQVNHPTHVMSMMVSVHPARGAVTVDPATGEVRYDATNAAPGVYHYEITWTDDLGQTATLAHAVTVHNDNDGGFCPVDDPDCDNGGFCPVDDPDCDDGGFCSVDDPDCDDGGFCPVDDPDCDDGRVCPAGEHCDDPTPRPSTGPRVGTGGSVIGGPGAGVVGLVLAGIAGLFAAAFLLGNRRRGGDDVGR